ncbi:TPA: hypothetical protein JD264_03090 [Serratia fonticola]|nr:hypothetical protein [Serratia fonticola]
MAPQQLLTRCDDLIRSAFRLLLRGRNESHRSNFSRTAMILSVQRSAFSVQRSAFSIQHCMRVRNESHRSSFSRAEIILSVQHSALHQSAQ